MYVFLLLQDELTQYCDSLTMAYVWTSRFYSRKCLHNF